MTIDQISIFLENRYGKLNQVLGLLADAGIGIIAANVADTSEFGIMRMIVSDPARAYAILRENNVSAHVAGVLAVEVAPHPDSFRRTVEQFTAAGLSIEYMYCFSICSRAILIARINDVEGVREVVVRGNMKYLSTGDLNELHNKQAR